MVAVSNKNSEAQTVATSQTTSQSGFGERDRKGFDFEVTRPSALVNMRGTRLVPVQSYIVKPCDQQFVRDHMPNLRESDMTVEICRSSAAAATFDEKYLHRVGIILSGGPAPGGHNVVAGVYDAMKEVQPASEIIGFVKGIDGLLTQQFIELTDEYVDSYRNTGGFDMLFSGRGCVKPEKEPEALRIIQNLKLTGLVIIGGDGTNSNTAAIANVVGADPQNKCSVIGVPKTIDGDLVNQSIEVSFGFDTASKVYSEQIGSIMADVSANRDCWHFIRIMGRLASHLVLECALQTHPNFVIIAEEVQQKNKSLSDIVNALADCIVDRRRRGLDHGVVLVPEGLITFIPEMQKLIEELSYILRDNPELTQETLTGLSEPSAKVWEQIPSDIRAQMLDEREASGYIVVAKIATEKFLADLVKQNLAKRSFNLETFKYNLHYFGYEGRCAIPSIFDANYTYALGLVAGQLILHRKNGYMATVRDLAKDVKDWKPVGVRFLDLLLKVTLPCGPTIAALMRQEVQLSSPMFQTLSACRDFWKVTDHYRTPGPMQYGSEISTKDQRNFYVDPPLALCDIDQLASVTLKRLNARPTLAPICNEDVVDFMPVEHAANAEGFSFEVLEPTSRKTSRINSVKIGVCFISSISAGCNNLLNAIVDKPNVSLIGFFNGFEGLRDDRSCRLTADMLKDHVNLGGITAIGAGGIEALEESDLGRMLNTCEVNNLNTLLLVGDNFEQIIKVSEYFKQKRAVCGVLGVPQSPHDSFHDLLGIPLGAATNLAVQNNLIGNAGADAYSMPKYYHFVRVDTAQKNSAQIVESAWATRPNVYIVGEDQDSLASIVVKIANCVQMRFEAVGKNYGVVLIPTSLWELIPELKNFIEGADCPDLKALPKNPFKKLEGTFENATQLERRRIIPLEEIIAKLVSVELSTRSSYKGTYQFVTHNLTYQGRGAMPVQLDCNLGATLGAASVLASRSGQEHCAVTVHKTSFASDDPARWLIKLIPLDLISMITRSDYPMRRLVYKAIDLEKATANEWCLKDRYANPGPIQWE